MPSKLILFITLRLLCGIKAQADEPQQTINLGRTSLAAVSASSVNGTRAMDNPFHGVLNAFDDGNNWHNNINYTSWLSDYHQLDTYADVDFDIPVTVTSIVMESAPPFVARVTADDGTEQVKSGKDSVSFDPPVSRARHVRLTFKNNNEGVVGVDEIRIMGLVPPGTKYEVHQPRVIPSKRNLELAADEAFTSWLYPYLTAKKKNVRETDDTIISVYYVEDVPVVRVTINRKDGSKKVETFSRDRPIIDEKPPDTHPYPTD